MISTMRISIRMIMFNITIIVIVSHKSKAFDSYGGVTVASTRTGTEGVAKVVLLSYFRVPQPIWSSSLYKKDLHSVVLQG